MICENKLVTFDCDLSTGIILNLFFDSTKYITMKRTLLILFISGVLISISFGQSQRLVLLEHFTQASCGPCAGVNPGITALLNANPDKFTAINYHTSWPGYDPMYNHNTVENGARTNYYSVNSVPNSVLDGNVYNGHPNGWNISTVNSRYDVDSPFDMFIHHELSEDENTMYLNVLIQATEVVGAGLKAQLAIIEKMIEFSSSPGSNGETDFNNVMKKMMPNQSGTTLPAFEVGDYVILQFAWEHQNVYDIEELAAIGFIQDNGTKEVHQSANSSDELFDALFSSDVEVSDVSNISLYNCDGKIQPQVKIRNNGSDALTSLDINYSMNGGEVTTYEWTGNLGFLESETILLSEITFTVNPVNSLEVSLESPNGQTDEYPLNNVQEIAIQKAPLGESTMVVYMILDANPEETTWEITNYEGDVIHEGGPYSTPGQTILEQLPFESTNCYTFTIYDAGGDGLSQGGSIAFGYGSTYLINETDFGSKAEAQFKIEFTGISNSILVNDLKLYPNPAGSRATLTFELIDNEEVKYTLINVLGESVKEVNFGEERAGVKNYLLDLSNLEEGIYYLQLKIGNAFKTEKLIITK